MVVMRSTGDLFYTEMTAMILRFLREMLIDIAKGHGPVFHQVFLGFSSWTHEVCKRAQSWLRLMIAGFARVVCSAYIDRYHMVATHVGVGNPAYVSCEQAEA